MFFQEVTMKKKNFKLVLACVLSLAAGQLFAQIKSGSAKAANTRSTMEYVEGNPYNNAIGLRAGETSGLTFKHFFGTNQAGEGIFSVSPNAVGLTGLFEKYVPFTSISGLNWYYGAGAHVTFGTGRLYYVYREGNRYYTYRSNYPGFGAGLDGVVGAEYKIPKIPFAISFDIKPFVELNNAAVIFTALDPSIGIKVTF
jgi:hypothetical protein